MKKPDSIQTILDTASSSKRHVAGLRGDFRSRLNAFRRHRSAEEQQELTEDFRHVLAAWGIADADIPGVITALRLRLVVFLLPGWLWPALRRPVCSAWSRRSGAFPFCVTVASCRCAAGCWVSASARSGRGCVCF